jgi:glucitol/sorbitol PTS system EIIC component
VPLSSIAAIPLAVTPDIAEPTGFFGVLANIAEGFIGIFQEGATFFVALLTGIVPLVIVLLTFVNALVKWIGPERIERLGVVAARPGIIYYPVRYLVLPILAVFFFTNPMAYTVGRFLPENKKPAFYDSAVSFVHPITGLFPHANAGELFVYYGIAAGLVTLGLGLGQLAVMYFLVGALVILIRGIVTEWITMALIRRREHDATEVAA